MRTRHQYGRRDSQTPRYDIPVVMHQQWRDGDVEAVKRHFDDPREKLPRHHGRPLCGLGAYNGDEAGYFKMWEELSGKAMDKNGFLVSIVYDGEGNRILDVGAEIDKVVKGRTSREFPSDRILEHNMMATIELLHDDMSLFLQYYTPILSGYGVKKAFKVWMQARGLDIFDSKQLCGSYCYDYTGKTLDILFMRTDELRKYTSAYERDLLRRRFHRIYK